MPIVRRSFVLLVNLIFFVAGSYVGSARALQGDQSVQTIEVTAKKYDFTPSLIRVKQGATVRLKITASDRTHGFRIDIYPDRRKRQGQARPRIHVDAGVHQAREEYPGDGGIRGPYAGNIHVQVLRSLWLRARTYEGPTDR